MPVDPAEDRIYIGAAAELLNRKIGTIRTWEPVLPDHLQPHRDGQNRRWWSKEQIDLIKRWMKDTDRRPGKSLPHYNPSRADVEQHITDLRDTRAQLTAARAQIAELEVDAKNHKSQIRQLKRRCKELEKQLEQSPVAA